MVDSFKTTSTCLVQHEKNLWTYDGSLTMLGGIFRLPSRMTIIRIEKTNELLIISPFPPTETIQKLLNEIGEVKFIVVPNIHHTFWALKFHDVYPNSFLIGTRGVLNNENFSERLHGFFTDEGLELNANNRTERFVVSLWPTDEIEFFCFYSVPFFDEIVFYHRPSSTLIVTDLAFNYSEIGENPVRAEGQLFRFYLWLADGYRVANVTKPFRYFFRKNIDQVRSDFDQLMNRYNNFQRLIMAHGTVIEQNGYESLSSGTYRFVVDLSNDEKQRKPSYSTVRFGFLVVVGGAVLFLISKYINTKYLSDFYA